MCGHDVQENFTLFTANPINFICSKQLDSLPRYVKFNNSGGIVTISHNPPFGQDYKQFKCPDFIDQSITLGTNNYCYKNKRNHII